MKTLAMFPGQGSQYVGMGKSVVAEFPYTAEVFEEAEEASKCRIRQICFDGPEADLTLTANTQPCILAVSVAIWQVLQRETDWRPDAFAGHSLGEYSALVAAGKLSLARAAFLVRRRGEAMQEAVPAGVGAMAAVLHMAAEELEGLCNELSDNDQSVEPVNYNSPGQIVVAGHKKAVERLCQDLEARGVRAVPLQVSAPFHSKLMRPAREAMTSLIAESVFEDNQAKVIANLTGKVALPYSADLLINQIDHAVLWTQSMQTASDELAIERFVEVGPGKVLFGLGRRALPRGVKLLATEDLPNAIKDLHS